MSDKLPNIGLELLAVGGTEVNDVSSRDKILDYLASGRLDDRHLIGSLIGLVCDSIPLVHTCGVGDFLGEVTLTRKGFGELVVDESEVDRATTNIDDLAIDGVNGRNERRHFD